MSISIQSKVVYNDAISPLAPGTELIPSACIVYSISACNETLNQNAPVSFSDSADTYDVNYRVCKVMTTPYLTTNIVFPNGLPCKYGLCAVTNVAGTNVTVTYE